MANILSKEKQVTVIGALAEGNSIRSIERQTGVNRNTIMTLNLRVGQACQQMMDEKIRDLNCERLEVDEIWGFIAKKQRNVTKEDSSEFGDVWTFIAIDAESKLIPAFRVGKRDIKTATEFVDDLASRMKNRVQLSSDSLPAYVEAVTKGFGVNNVDYGQIVKSYSVEETRPERKYSPAHLVKVNKSRIIGTPKPAYISTSYVERQNLTLRHHCKRLARLTLAFSKKMESFKAAVALNFAYYNFCKIHKTIRCTPAMAAGVVPSIWTVGDLVDMVG